MNRGDACSRPAAGARRGELGVVARGTLIGVVAVLAVGCSGPAQPSATSRPAPAASRPAAAASAPTTRTVLVPEVNEWSAEECLANLDDDELRVSAAVRLVRLSGRPCAAVPPRLDQDAASRLRVERLDAGTHVLGVADASAPRAIRNPVLIDAGGAVHELSVVNPPGSGAAASQPGPEGAVLIVSTDGEVFPHVVVTRTRVYLAAAPDKPALTLRRPDDLRFDVRSGEGYEYVALLHESAAGEECEAARYLWDPFELRFMGPASDRLAPPLSGRFELDLNESHALLPVGGEIPAPDPLKPVADQPRDPS